MRCAYWAEDSRTDRCGGTGWERTRVKADLGFGFEELMSWAIDTGRLGKGWVWRREIGDCF